MTGPLIPFRIDLAALPGWNGSDPISRYGAILKNDLTGRIVGHVQEAQGAQALIRQAFDLTLAADGPISAVGSLVGIVQNEQIKERLDLMQAALGTIEGLEIASLASAFVGIGVTIASTAMILHRLDTVGQAVARIEESIGELPERWREMRIREVLVTIATELARLEEAASASRRGGVVTNAEDRLDHGFARIADTLRQMASEARIRPALVRALVAAMALSAGAQIRALLELDDLRAAKDRSARHVRTMEELSWAFPRDLTAASGEAEAATLPAELSEVRLRIASQPSLLTTLIDRKIRGPDYLAQAREAQDAPAMLLPAEAPSPPGRRWF